MQKQIIVLIGGPGTGKSTLLDALAQKGYRCYPEISREVTINAKNQGIDQLFLEDPLRFSELLLDGRKKQYDDAVRDETNLIFIDRGIPDVVAYLDYINTTYPSHFEDACMQYRYDHIFVLPPWKEIFLSDSERYENFEQAVAIQEHITRTYERFGYRLIAVPTGKVEQRIEKILNFGF
jgi:predicted ATPase